MGNLRAKGWYSPIFEFHTQIADRCGRDWTFSPHQPIGGLNSAPDLPARRAYRRASLQPPAEDTKSRTGRGKLAPQPGACECEHQVKAAGPRRYIRWREVIRRCLNDADDGACLMLFYSGHFVDFKNSVEIRRPFSPQSCPSRCRLSESPGEWQMALIPLKIDLQTRGDSLFCCAVFSTFWPP